MSNDNSVQPEQSVPDPVQWAVNIHRVEALRVAKIDRDIQTMDTRIAETKALLAELEDNHEGALRALAIASKNAIVALEMAERICKEYGWTLPEPKGEPPLNETSRFPAVPPLDATQVIPYIARYPDFVGHRVVVVLDDGTGRDGMAYEGLFDLDSNGGSSFCLAGMDGESSFMIRELAEIRSIRLVEPAEVSDQTTATPAASVPDSTPNSQTEGGI